MADSDTKPPKVFISYAHENREHAARVLALADQLIHDGLDMILDQYDPVPREGWPVWMRNGLDDADYVLLICSPAYYRRVMGKESPGVGLGAQWEGQLIHDSLYANKLQGHKYIPVLLAGCATADIPDIVRGYHRFAIAAFDFTDPGYEDLYRHLTGQPKVRRPARGQIRQLDVESVMPAAPDPTGETGAARPTSPQSAEAVKPPRGAVIELPDTASPTPSPLAGRAGVGSTRINPIDGAEMILIPAGEFTMGSDVNDREKPVHKVHLDDFYMYKTPVTVAMYRKFCDATRRQMPTAPLWGWNNDSYPMVKLSWNDASAYAEWAGVSLPTEAQWEKAARGTDARIYPWGNKWDPAKCRCSKDKLGDAQTPSPVGSYPSGASPYGLLDMAGNVWEWCLDWFAGDYYRNAPTRNPPGPEKGKYRVLRGGAWLNDVGDFFRCACRDRLEPDNWLVSVGFRGVSRPGSS